MTDEPTAPTLEQITKDRMADKCSGWECPQGQPCACKVWAWEQWESIQAGEVAEYVAVPIYRA